MADVNTTVSNSIKYELMTHANQKTDIVKPHKKRSSHMLYMRHILD